MYRKGVYVGYISLYGDSRWTKKWVEQFHIFGISNHGNDEVVWIFAQLFHPFELPSISTAETTMSGWRTYTKAARSACDHNYSL